MIHLKLSIIFILAAVHIAALPIPTDPGKSLDLGEFFKSPSPDPEMRSGDKWRELVTPPPVASRPSTPVASHHSTPFPSLPSTPVASRPSTPVAPHPSTHVTSSTHEPFSWDLDGKSLASSPNSRNPLPSSDTGFEFLKSNPPSQAPSTPGHSGSFSHSGQVQEHPVTPSVGSSASLLPANTHSTLGGPPHASVSHSTNEQSQMQVGSSPTGLQRTRDHVQRPGPYDREARPKHPSQPQIQEHTHSSSQASGSGSHPQQGDVPTVSEGGKKKRKEGRPFREDYEPIVGGGFRCLVEPCVKVFTNANFPGWSESQLKEKTVLHIRGHRTNTWKRENRKKIRLEKEKTK